MPYIVKSSLDIGGKVIPWNEQETKKLIKEKENYLKNKKVTVQEEEKKDEELNKTVDLVDKTENKVENKNAKNVKNENRRIEKAGEK